jgi:hypothetical protein
MKIDMPMTGEIDADSLAPIIDRRAQDWTPEALHETFVRYGCAVVRRMAPIEAVQEVEAAVAAAYSVKTTPGKHVCDPEIAAASAGRVSGYELVDTPLLSRFLALVYEGQAYRRSSVTARRIRVVDTEMDWQKPLDLHLDCQIHPFRFTVNFWIPFQDCGVEAPGLQLLPLGYRETRRYAGFTGAVQRDGQPWNWNYFEVDFFDPDQIMKDFGDNAFLRPVMQPGDLIVSSNWIIHGSYRTPQMRSARTNIEVRFIGDEIDLSGATAT